MELPAGTGPGRHSFPVCVCFSYFLIRAFHLPQPLAPTGPSPSISVKLRRPKTQSQLGGSPPFPPCACRGEGHQEPERWPGTPGGGDRGDVPAPDWRLQWQWGSQTLRHTGNLGAGCRGERVTLLTLGRGAYLLRVRASVTSFRVCILSFTGRPALLQINLSYSFKGQESHKPSGRMPAPRGHDTKETRIVVP